MDSMEIVISRDCIYKDNKIYFFSEKESILVAIDITKNIGEIQQIKNRELYRKVPFDFVTSKNNTIYALEMSGKYMCEYCVDTQEIRYIQIDCNNRVDGNFALLATEDNQVLIFERMYGVTIYDTKNEIVQKIPYPFIEGEVITGCKYENHYFLFHKNGHKIFEFDISLKKWNTICLKRELKHVMHVIADKANIFILSEDGIIIRWDVRENVNILETAKKCYNVERAASKICVTNNSIIVLPSLAEDILIIDKLTYEVKIFQKYPEDFRYKNNNWTKYYGYCENEESYFFACRKSPYILKVDKINDNISWIKSKLKSKLLFDYKLQDGIIYEKEEYLGYLIKEL